jgi:hypothetical protein
VAPRDQPSRACAETGWRRSLGWKPRGVVRPADSGKAHWSQNRGRRREITRWSWGTLRPVSDDSGAQGLGPRRGNAGERAADRCHDAIAPRSGRRIDVEWLDPAPERGPLHLLMGRASWGPCPRAHGKRSFPALFVREFPQRQAPRGKLPAGHPCLLFVGIIRRGRHHPDPGRLPAGWPARLRGGGAPGDPEVTAWANFSGAPCRLRLLGSALANGGRMFRARRGSPPGPASSPAPPRRCLPAFADAQAPLPAPL